MLRIAYEMRIALQQIWGDTLAGPGGLDMPEAIRQWVRDAEASKIRSLREFAKMLRTYSLRPADSGADGSSPGQPAAWPPRR